MLDWIKDNRTSLLIAVLLHIVFLAALFINWQADKPKKIILQQGNVIEVNSVDANRYAAEIRKIEEQKAAQLKQQRAAEKQAREQKRQQAQRKKQAEQKAREERLAKEQKRKAEAELKRKKEQKRKEELKRKEAEAKKIAEQQAAEKKAAEQKRKQAEARAKEEARLKKEQEQKAQEEKARVEKAKAEKLKAEAEQQRQQAERARRSKGIIDRHVGLIVLKIENNWRQPLNAPAGLSCKIEIKLASSGKVQEVRIIESSGNTVFDKSVETAVLKASPLPVPADNEIFQQFKTMRFIFTPGSY